MKKHLLLPLIVCSLGGIPGAHGALIASDSFETADAVPRALHNWNGGSGWLNDWDAGSSSNTNLQIVATNMTYTVMQDAGAGPDVPYLALDGGAKALRISGNTNGQRPLATANVGVDYYVSFLYQVTGGVVSGNDVIQLVGYDNASNPNPWWGQNGDAAGTISAGVPEADVRITGPAAGNPIHLVVGKAVWNPSLNRFDTIQLWVDPVLTMGGDLSTAAVGVDGYYGAYAIASTSKPQALDGFRFKVSGLEAGSDVVLVDDLRAGTTLNDVIVGTPVIPEPGTITGLGVLALASILRRRRAL